MRSYMESGRNREKTYQVVWPQGLLDCCSLYPRRIPEVAVTKQPVYPPFDRHHFILHLHVIQARAPTYHPACNRSLSAGSSSKLYCFRVHEMSRRCHIFLPMRRKPTSPQLIAHLGLDLRTPAHQQSPLHSRPARMAMDSKLHFLVCAWLGTRHFIAFASPGLSRIGTMPPRFRFEASHDSQDTSGRR